jgi:hypothetical protein
MALPEVYCRKFIILRYYKDGPQTEKETGRKIEFSLNGLSERFCKGGRPSYE